MEQRIISEKYEKIGMEIIEKSENVDFSLLNASIEKGKISLIFLESDKDKKSHGMAVCADCEKVADNKRWAIDADFVITVYAPNVTNFSEDQLKVLILHELMHIGLEFTSKGELKKYIVPHSVQDFRYILQTYGIDWETKLQREFEF